MINIADRPAEVQDRAVPGHWEGDLIVGRNGKSAIGTLVERTTRFVVLLHLPGAHGATEVEQAMLTAISHLPQTLRRTLTWDQGNEMFQHQRIEQATGLTIYFADLHSPWQRGSNENINGLLRQYFPKGTDLNAWTVDQLNYVLVICIGFALLLAAATYALRLYVNLLRVRSGTHVTDDDPAIRVVPTLLVGEY